MDKIISSSQINDRYSIYHLFLSDRLEESGSPKLILASILSITGLLTLILLWSAIVTVDEVTVGKGRILPSEAIYPVQHLEGGIVYAIHFKDGDIVSPGETLFSLSQEPHVSDLKQLKKRMNSLEIEIYRAQAEIEQRNILKEDLLNSISFPEVTEAKLLNLQLSNVLRLHQEQLQQLSQDMSQTQNQLNQEKRNLENVKKQIFHLQKRQKLLEDEEGIFKKLEQQKATSKLNLLNSKDRLQEVIGELLEVVRQETLSETAVMDLEQKLLNLENEQTSEALERLNKLTAELLEVQEQLMRAQTRVDRLNIVTPVGGIIKGLELSPGTVIAPAEILFEVIPLSEDLVAEIRISTNDIGHVQKGDSVQVKVDTYDFASYGQIKGELISISASTFLDDENQPYYKGVAKLAKGYLGDNPEKNRIFPGMTLIADIKTDQKSLLAYLLKPVNRTFRDAFTER